ncbi:unnamed protein product, partial [Arabidopsis halleri]
SNCIVLLTAFEGLDQYLTFFELAVFANQSVVFYLVPPKDFLQKDKRRFLYGDKLIGELRWYVLESTFRDLLAVISCPLNTFFSASDEPQNK